MTTIVNRTKKGRVVGGAALLAGLLLGTLGSTPAGAATPIVFPPGSHHAVAHGTMSGIHSVRLFTFHAHSGQHVKVKISGSGPTRGTVTSPSGQQDGGPGGVVFDNTVTVTGTYRLRVTESQMGSAWHGPFRVDVWRN